MPFDFNPLDTTIQLGENCDRLFRIEGYNEPLPATIEAVDLRDGMHNRRSSRRRPAVTVFIGTGDVTTVNVRSGVGGPCSLGFAVLLLCATATAAAGSGAWSASPGEASMSAATIERDSVLLRVDVRENGSAQWRIEYRTRLEDTNTTRAFESLQRDIEEDPDTYSRDFFDGINATIATAENATGREMAGTDYDVRAEVNHLPQRYGVVVYTFTWRGFATVNGSDIHVGDALAGFFLGENERLLLSWPTGYELQGVQPPADERRDRTVVWTGPMEFGPNEPRVVLTPTVGEFWQFPWLPWVSVVLLVAVAIAAGAMWLRRRDGIAVSKPNGNGFELLSNEEQVLRAIENRGGRARQQEIVDALDWTEAKTSRVISTLREQGRVDSFRLGRENVLALPDLDD